jgi:hypothetical protein
VTGDWQIDFAREASRRGYGLRQCHYDPMLTLWTVLLDDGTTHGLEIERSTTVGVRQAIRKLPLRQSA